MPMFTLANGTNTSSHLTDQDLICSLLDIPSDEINGDTVVEILDHLLKNSEKSERVSMVREIAYRYGENRLQPDTHFTQSVQVYEHFRMRLGDAKQESFIAVLLDNKHRIIKEQLISLGILNQSLVHPREVFAPAIEARAAAIVLIHNHPSGDPAPSSQDIEITKRLVEVGSVVGINVIDHVIVGTDKYYSFVDEGMMP